jgi:hypothetical protein
MPRVRNHRKAEYEWREQQHRLDRQAIRHQHSRDLHKRVMKARRRLQPRVRAAFPITLLIVVSVFCGYAAGAIH